jgi:flavin-dependent dehydrogenase
LLARLGRRVVVVEREVFPRFHIGESLLPRSMKALERSGVLPKIEAAGFVQKHGAEIASGCGSSEARFYFEDGLDPESPTAWQVTRSEFDKILLDHAAECGADVRQGCEVRAVHREADRVRVETSQGTLDAPYVLDATGRHALMARFLNLKRNYPGLHKIAVYAHYDNVPRPEGRAGTVTRMVRAKDRWFWLIPLSPTRMSVGVVMDSELFRTSKKSPAEMLATSIEGIPHLCERLAAATRCTEVHVSSDYSYRVEQLHGDRWLAAGDAAGFIDPVFSSGVFLAILGAEQAADALHEALDRPAAARRLFSRHARQLQQVMRLYLKFVESWYRQEFVETVLSPREFFGVVQAVNAVLAGNRGTAFRLRWRLWLFHTIVALQRHVPLCPRLPLSPH